MRFWLYALLIIVPFFVFLCGWIIGVRMHAWPVILVAGQEMRIQSETGLIVHVGISDGETTLICHQNDKIVASFTISKNMMEFQVESYPEIVPSLWYSKHMDSGTLYTFYDANLLPIKQVKARNGFPIYSVDKLGDIFSEKPFQFSEKEEVK